MRRELVSIADGDGNRRFVADGDGATHGYRDAAGNAQFIDVEDDTDVCRRAGCDEPAMAYDHGMPHRGYCSPACFDQNAGNRGRD